MEQGMSQSLPEQVILVDIDKDNTSVEDSKRQDHDYVLRDNDGIRGDYNGFRSSYRRAIDNEEITPPASPQFQEIDIPAYLESTRQFRPNSKHNTLQRGNNSDPTLDNHRYPHSSGSDHTSYDHILDSSDTDFRKDMFPLQVERRPSAYSLRNRRSPHYQGNRAVKSKRVMGKHGIWNIFFSNIPNRHIRFYKDFVTTLIEEQWRYTLTVFALSFFLCWLLFAVGWYLIALAHGDLNYDPITGEQLSDGNQPCVNAVKGFAGYLLLSIETQVSIGFGVRYPNEECPEAIFLMMLQLILGVILEGAMVGIVYAKMVRPTRRNYDHKFSKKAVICLRDGALCLLFRIDDVRQSHIVGTRVRAFLLEERRSNEGERLGQYQHELELESGGRVFILWPQTIAHRIDSASPLYNLSAKDLLEKRFEIILTITGASRSTAQVTQARTSYLTREVMWGYRFKQIFNYDYSQQAYVADYDHFDEVEPIDTALCSARRLAEVIDEFNMMNDNVDDFSEYPHDYEPDYGWNSGLDNDHRINIQRAKENRENEKLEASYDEISL